MERKRAIRRVGFVVLAANVLLVAGKAGVWWTTGSLALGSEAVNSLADAVYSTIILGGLYLTTKPPDWEHPHGHERIEPFISLFVAVGIFAAGGRFSGRARPASSRGLTAETRGRSASSSSSSRRRPSTSSTATATRSAASRTRRRSSPPASTTETTSSPPGRRSSAWSAGSSATPSWTRWPPWSSPSASSTPATKSSATT